MVAEWILIFTAIACGSVVLFALIDIGVPRLYDYIQNKKLGDKKMSNQEKNNQGKKLSKLDLLARRVTLCEFENSLKLGFAIASKTRIEELEKRVSNLEKSNTAIQNDIVECNQEYAELLSALEQGYKAAQSDNFQEDCKDLRLPDDIYAHFREVYLCNCRSKCFGCPNYDVDSYHCTYAFQNKLDDLINKYAGGVDK